MNTAFPTYQFFPLTPVVTENIRRHNLVNGLRCVFERVRLEALESSPDSDVEIFAAACLFFDIGFQFSFTSAEMKAMLGDYAARIETVQ